MPRRRRKRLRVIRTRVKMKKRRRKFYERGLRRQLKVSKKRMCRMI